MNELQARYFNAE